VPGTGRVDVATGVGEEGEDTGGGAGRGGKETGVDWLEPVFLRASEVLMIRGTAPGRRCLREGEPQEGEGLLQAK